jgi:hypothetical protein
MHPRKKNLPPILGQKFVLTDLCLRCTCTTIRLAFPNRAHTSHMYTMYMYMCLAKLSGDGWYCGELQLSQNLLTSDTDNFQHISFNIYCACCRSDSPW